MKLWQRLRLFVNVLARRMRRAPPAPGRFKEAVKLFTLARPGASSEAWEAFAVQLAEGAYWEGVARGIHRSQGKPLPEERALHDWNAARGRPWLVQALAGRDPADPLRGLTDAQRRAFAEQVSNAVKAGVRIHLVQAEPGSPFVSPPLRAGEASPPVVKSCR